MNEWITLSENISLPIDTKSFFIENTIVLIFTAASEVAPFCVASICHYLFYTGSPLGILHFSSYIFYTFLYTDHVFKVWNNLIGI